MVQQKSIAMKIEETPDLAIPDTSPAEGRHHRARKAKVGAYATSTEHLLDELGRVDLLVRAQVFRARQANEGDELRGLSISDDDVDEMLERSIGKARWESAEPPLGLGDINAAIAKRAREIERRRRYSQKKGVELRLDALAKRFGLDPFETDVLLLALAPELDARYGRLFAYLHDDITRSRLSVELALALLIPTFEERLAARRYFIPSAPLLRHGLIKLSAETPDRDTPLIRCPVKVDGRIVNYLVGIDAIEPPLSARARRVVPRALLGTLLIQDSLRGLLSRLAEERDSNARARDVFYLRGAYGVGKQSTAEALAAALGFDLLVVDGQSLKSAPEDAIAEIARLAAREARLYGAALYWDGYDVLLASDKKSARAAVIAAVEEFPGYAFLSGEAAWDPADSFRSRPFLRVDLGLPSYVDQTKLWATALADGLGGAEGNGPAIDVSALANRYRLSGGQIRDAVATAKNLARLQDPERGEVTLDHIATACRMCSSPNLTALAHRVSLRNTWDDLVLAKDRVARLREICNHARFRGTVLDTWGFEKKLSGGKGLSLLFAGPPGTGKTMAAGVMASELGLDLYSIDLSNVVNKYIGETEKQLAKIFDEAERSNAILFFDEADALFGKRTEVKDAHDRYANIETSYLLQRMETYEGVAILATNLSQNMDEAFVRRIHFIVDFTLPDERERLRIWERIWPALTPRDPSVDLAFMARRFDIAGGHIRNIALAASFLAAAEGSAVTQKHLIHATRREYQKMGRIIDERLFSQRS
jgi:AAA+ superfamily predicted ATPase